MSLNSQNHSLRSLVDIYTQYPVYGYRRLTTCLKRQGYHVNGKHVLRIMRQIGLRAIYPQPKTTVVNKAHEKFPYLLRNVLITKPHQVWQIDVTYLCTNHVFI